MQQTQHHRHHRKPHDNCAALLRHYGLDTTIPHIEDDPQLHRHGPRARQFHHFQILDGQRVCGHRAVIAAADCAAGDGVKWLQQSDGGAEPHEADYQTGESGADERCGRAEYADECVGTESRVAGGADYADEAAACSTDGEYSCEGAEESGWCGFGGGIGDGGCSLRGYSSFRAVSWKSQDMGCMDKGGALYIYQM